MIGTRGHDIGCKSAAELAQDMQDVGLEAVQMVPYKCIDGLSDKAGHLSPGLAYSISHEFDKRGIHIALLGSYFNPLEQDTARLDESMNRFKEYLRFAKDFRCHIVGTETGSYNPDMSFHPDNHGGKALQIVIDIFKELTKEAEHHGAMVGVEGVHQFVVSTPQRMKLLLDAVDSTNLQVILDPVNFLHISNYENVKKIVEESFTLFGEKIIMIHAKDFIIENNQIKTVPLGRGLMDYEHLLTVVHKHKPSIDIIIEELSGAALEESHQFLKGLVNKLPI